MYPGITTQVIYDAYMQPAGIPLSTLHSLEDKNVIDEKITYFDGEIQRKGWFVLDTLEHPDYEFATYKYPDRIEERLYALYHEAGELWEEWGRLNKVMVGHTGLIGPTESMPISTSFSYIKGAVAMLNALAEKLMFKRPPCNPSTTK